MNEVVNLNVPCGQEGGQFLVNSLQPAQIAHPYQMAFWDGTSLPCGFELLRIDVGQNELPGRGQFLRNAPAETGGGAGDQCVGFTHANGQVAS